MKIIVISSYSVIREGIEAVLSNRDDITVQFSSEMVKDALLMIRGNTADVLLVDIHKNNKEELTLINELRISGANIKSIMIDFNGDYELFMKSLKCGVQGYILGKSSKEDILYAIDQVYKGKKYFDAYFVDLMINENNDFPDKLDLFTLRERQILMEIAKGLSNQRIGNKFFITEDTVKRHISNIFKKLNISNSTEVS